MSWRASLISKIVVSIRFAGLEHQQFRRFLCLHAASMVIALCHFAVASIPLTFFAFQYLIEFHYNLNQLAWVRFFPGLLS
jgi:hypothetical protein